MRDLQAHPLAELFPLMDETTFRALVSDIKANGLREAIYLWEGQILDGRNRYNACRELGISPITRNWDGPGDPLDFVVSKNLVRRHLDESQRATVAGKIANMKRGGDRGNQHTGGKRPIGRLPDEAPISNSEAAKLMNVSERSVRRARVVLEKGAPELQAAVENGAVSVNAAAALAYTLPVEEQKEVVSQGPAAVTQAAKAARLERPKLSIVAKDPPQPKAPSTRAYISVPEGSTVEAQVRKGIALEADGTHPEKAAKEIGIGDRTYRFIKDLIILLEDLELNPGDHQTVAKVLSAINETKQLTGQDAVEPIIRRVWGSSKNNHHTVKTARKRVEHFATVVSGAVQSCLNFDLEEFEIPYLSEEETRRWIKELELARRSLDGFLKKLKAV